MRICLWLSDESGGRYLIVLCQICSIMMISSKIITSIYFNSLSTFSYMQPLRDVDIGTSKITQVFYPQERCPLLGEGVVLFDT